MSGTTSDKPIGDKPVATAPTSASGADKSAAATPLAQKNAQAGVPAPPVAPAMTTSAQRTVKCPKCGTDVREVARFCQRCHHTMRYECPSCHNQQRTGGKCEKCGIDFLKYIGAVVTQKQAEADAIHDRLEQRSTLMKNILWLPFTLGYPIIRDYFVKRDRKK
jgi:zinc-ribbon domain